MGESFNHITSQLIQQSIHAIIIRSIEN